MRQKEVVTRDVANHMSKALIENQIHIESSWRFIIIIIIIIIGIG